MMEPLEFYGLFAKEDIGKRLLRIPCDEFSDLTLQATFHPTGTIIDGKELVGVQLEPDVVQDFVDQTEGTGLWDALLKLDAIAMGLDDFYVCRRDEPEILFGKYPHLVGTHIETIDGVETEVKNFSGWGGVQQ